MVIHVWAELPLLSVGLHRARTGDRALRAATARELLVLHYFLRRVLGSECVYRRGSAAGLGVAAGRVSGVWTKVAHPEGGDGDSGPGASGRGRPEVRLLSSGGTAGERICANGSTGTRGSAFCGGHADFDDSGDALQLRGFSEDGEPAG